MDTSNYQKIHDDTKNFYDKIGGEMCPALGKFVTFTSEGFNHLIFKGPRKERSKEEQIAKFKLVPSAHRIVKKSSTYQEYEETLKEVDVQRHKKRLKESKIVRYWGLIAIEGGRKLKVIVRQVGDDGKLHFWSVIPDWNTTKHRDIRFRTLMKGNPDED